VPDSKRVNTKVWFNFILLFVNFILFIYLVLFDFWCPICLRNQKWKLEAKKILGVAIHPENAGDFQFNHHGMYRCHPN
jgi:hypothetical protein